MMITIVVSMPITKLVPTMTRAAVSTVLLYIVQELQFGLQSPASFMKRSSVQNKVVLSLAFCG